MSDRGKLTGVQCGLSFSNYVGGAVHADVVIKPGSEGGTLKGTLIDLDEAGFVAALCSFTAKRISTADPGPSPCF
jgi:energy-converting hydrogenase Eha subunit B